jgi:tagatose-1,6-bisphosphate aldolase non-catalytic subunit AgaZ/GatZ
MKPLNELIHQSIELRRQGKAQITLLGACPNSEAVLEAAVKVAAENRCPMLLAATLNQVDRDGGYTGWTPKAFVEQTKAFSQKYHWDGPIYPCLDHGGLWLKDLHTLNHLTLEQTMSELKLSITAFLEAGYQLLHIDPTVDRTLPAGKSPAVETIVARTVELITHAENERKRLGLPPISYEVGSEEVHGGLVDMGTFNLYLKDLKIALAAHGLEYVWPSFIVAQVGTNLHTTFFDAKAARQLFEIVSPMGSLIKGHYSDFVDNPRDYPLSGMGGANVGPEFTAIEYQALENLEAKEAALHAARPTLQPSLFMQTLEAAVVASGRWKKWLQPDEVEKSFDQLSPERRSWLAQTGARYIWTEPSVVAARKVLYTNLSAVMDDPSGYVVERIAISMEKYVNAFNLFDSLEIFES